MCVFYTENKGRFYFKKKIFNTKLALEVKPFSVSQGHCVVMLLIFLIITNHNYNFPFFNYFYCQFFRILHWENLPHSRQCILNMQPSRRWMATGVQTLSKTCVHTPIHLIQILGGGWICKLYIPLQWSEYSTGEWIYME